jgi:hypothetical protein
MNLEICNFDMASKPYINKCKDKKEEEMIYSFICQVIYMCIYFSLHIANNFTTDERIY